MRQQSASWFSLSVVLEKFHLVSNREAYVSENLMNGDSPYPQLGPIGKVLPLPTPVEITGRTTGDGSDEEASSSPVSSLDKRHAHTHTMSTRRVCWHRNTSISMTEHSLSVRVSVSLLFSRVSAASRDYHNFKTYHVKRVLQTKRFDNWFEFFCLKI